MATILVVDDEPEIAALLSAMLQADGHKIMEAGNGQIALERLGVEPAKPEIGVPDLIVLDIMMPVMDGYALNNRLQREAKTKAIPILVLTAKGQKMRDLFEMAPNVAAYVQKPFDPKMLRELIASILAGKKPAWLRAGHGYRLLHRKKGKGLQESRSVAGKKGL